jgi:hypothetical protein
MGGDSLDFSPTVGGQGAIGIDFLRHRDSVLNKINGHFYEASNFR